MAVAFESDGGTVFANANNNNAITVPLPATRPVGSVLLLIWWSRATNDGPSGAPSGWTQIHQRTSGTSAGGIFWIYGRVVDGSEVAPTIAAQFAVTGNSGDLWGACIFCYSGVDTSGGITAIFDGTPTVTDASGTTTCTYPALTITFSDSMVVRFLARFRDAVDTFTPTATWDEREDAGSTTRTGAQFHLQDKLASLPGSQAAVTVAPSNTTASRYLAITLALKKLSGSALQRTLDPETLGLADATAKARGKTRADSLAFSDARAFSRGYGRALAEVLGLTDLATPVEGGGAPPPEFTRTIKVVL